MVNRHRAIYRMSIIGFEQGAEAIQALDLVFDTLPLTEEPLGDGPAGLYQSVPNVTMDNIGDVYRTSMFSSDGTEQLVQILEDEDNPGVLIFDTIDG